MQLRFVEPIFRYLGNIDQNDSAKRREVYEKFRAMLRNMHNGDGKSQAYMDDALELEQSIERVESHFKPEPSWFERHLAPIKAVVEKFKSQYGFIATAATLISDFIKPVLDLTMPIAVGSLAGGAIFLVASRIFGSAREKLQGAAAVCGLFLVCSTGLLGAQHLLPGAADKGVIADAIPGASKVQKAILASLGRIEANTERTAQGVEGVKQSVDTLKKESSDDPRKELANMGIAWTEDAFAAAVLSGDRLATTLFMRAGRQVQTYLAVRFADTDVFRKDIGDILLRSKDQIDRKICTEDAIPAMSSQYGMWLQPDFITQKLKDADRRKFYFDLCDAGVIRAAYQAKIDGLGGDAASLESRAADQATKRKACEADFSKKYLPVPRGTNPFEADRLAAKVYDEAAATTERYGKMSGRLALDFQSREHVTVLSDIDSARMAGSNSDAIVGQMIARGCATAYPKPSPPDQSKLKRMQSVVDAIDTYRGVAVARQASAAPAATAAPVATAPEPGPAPTVTPVPTPVAAAPAPPQPQQPRGDTVLGAGDIRRDIIGKNLNHAGKIDITFGPDGTFASGDGRIGRNGKYRLEADGRLCWQDNMGFDGCFQYFRENGVLKVRRNDPKSRDLIGTVKVTSR